MSTRRWTGLTGEACLTRAPIDEGGCPFTEQSPLTPLYRDAEAVTAAREMAAAR